MTEVNTEQIYKVASTYVIDMCDVEISKFDAMRIISLMSDAIGMSTFELATKLAEERNRFEREKKE